MALYLQHGYGKSTKIDDAIEDGSAQGVIFSPRNETPQNLAACIQRYSGHSAFELLLDPQFHVSTFLPPRDQHLPEYPYYRGSLSTRDFTNRMVREYAQHTIEFQHEIGTTAIISPTVMFESFTDRWCQIALNLADASLECHAGLGQATPLLLSFVFAEQALSNEVEVDRFLDTVTQNDWNMSGFYLIIARHENNYNQDFESSRLATLLYLIHVLGHINEFRVVMGYTDFLGIPLRAAGASAFATGWTQGGRQFLRKNFIVQPPGGQAPRNRYSSGPLLNNIFLQELAEIHEQGQVREVLSRVPLDELLTADDDTLHQDAWNLPISQRHHWQTLHSLDDTITGQANPDVRRVLRRVREAEAIYTILENAGMEFETFTGKTHLANWARGIAAFARRAGLAT